MEGNREMIIRQLGEILTPELLCKVYELGIPAPSASAKELFDGFFGENPGRDDTLRALVFDSALIPLSKLPALLQPEIVDWLQILPEPSSNDFPLQALGLHYLLDQSTRICCKGINSRWPSSFFDPLALQLGKQLDALPQDKSPYKSAKWMQCGLTWQASALRASVLTTAHIHSELLSSQQRGQQLVEDLRNEVELFSGRECPYRSSDEADLQDAHGLPRLVFNPPSVSEHDDVDKYLFFSFRVDRVHLPVITKFSRYPWRNTSAGRVSTDEELRFIDEINHFGCQKPEVAEKIRKDVESGNWSPVTAS